MPSVCWCQKLCVFDKLDYRLRTLGERRNISRKEGRIPTHWKRDFASILNYLVIINHFVEADNECLLNRNFIAVISTPQSVNMLRDVGKYLPIYVTREDHSTQLRMIDIIATID